MKQSSHQQDAVKEFYTIYTTSDADNDGLLNAQEWNNFAKAYSKKKAERGEPETAQTDETRAKWYKVMNQVQSGVEGADMTDIGAVLAVSMRHMQARLVQGR